MTIASTSSHHNKPAFEYGWVRGTGSAAFIIGTLMAGQAIAVTGLAIVLWLQAVLLIVTLVMTYRLPDRQRPALAKTSTLSTREEVLTLLRLRTYRRLVIVATLVLGSHAMHDAFAMVRWQAAGVSSVTASILWAEAVAGEVIVFYVIGPALLRHFTPAAAIALAATAGIVRWIAMAQTAAVPALVLIQPLHGLTFALLHMACMRVLAQTVPAGMEGTAQAIYGTVGIGSISAVLTLGSGSLYAMLGSQGFLAMAMLCLLALPLTAGLRVQSSLSSGSINRRR
jgi:PPP family 3-phenylpropionic acid transporter